jgi:hypothetical protein
MLTRIALAFITTAILISPIRAQIRVGVSGPAGNGTTPGANGPPGSQGSGVSRPGRFHPGHDFGHRAVLLPYPYFYPDYGYESEETPEPQVVPVPVRTVAPAPPTPPLEPLLIEWQGDHFVRMTAFQNDSGSRQSAPDYSERAAHRPVAPGRKVVTVPPPRELPHAVLVFHDGREEEVSSYTIVNGTIYSKADYWTSGTWTRKIQIAELDVPATLKLNRERGLKFVLPGGPHEVILRP